MNILIYPKCSTCKKAIKWLNDEGVNHTVRHIVEEPLSIEEIKSIHEKSGENIKKFFNTSGKLYKELALKDKIKVMSDEEKIDILASNGMLVKRPILVKDDIVLVGFKEEEYNNIK